MTSPTGWRRALFWALGLALIIFGAGLAGWSLHALLASQPSAPAAPTPTLAAAKPTTQPLLRQLLPQRPTATATATATPIPVRLALPDPLPAELQSGLLAWLDQQPGGQLASDSQSATLSLTLNPGGEPVVERFYVPATRFASLLQDVAAADLLALWRDGPANGQQSLIVDADTAAALRLLWGQPAGQVEVLPDVLEVTGALRNDPQRLAIIPFDRLIPQLNALSVGGNDPTNNDFAAMGYPLALRLFVGQQPEAGEIAADLRAYLAETRLKTNRDPAKLTVLIMTGVTAMSRLTAQVMEERGYEYPAEVVGPMLAQADLTHISNEVPFLADCQVNTRENNVTLCSRPEYLAALRGVGVNLVGLTGNHLNDFGRQASLDSLQFYVDEDLPTYGGGANGAEAWKALWIEHNGNRLAFLGANSFGPQLAWAEPEWPGAAPYSYSRMAQAIADARQQGADLVLVELQWEESYDTLPLRSQKDEFRLLSAAGADIVTGVQSHVPQAIEFGDGGLILYGLGNFFFDQMWSMPTREGLIPRHTIYDGRHLSTKLLTTVLENYAQPRWTAEAERETLLGRVFAASGY